MIFVESSLAILVVIGFITILISYSIISPKITSLDEFLLNQITKRQIFCFLVCFPPFYIIILIITRIILFPGNVIIFLYDLYNCSRSQELSQKCSNFDEVCF